MYKQKEHMGTNESYQQIVEVGKQVGQWLLMCRPEEESQQEASRFAPQTPGNAREIKSPLKAETGR